MPDPRVRELTRAIAATGLPILVVEQDSYETATRVRDLYPGLPVDDLDRIEAMTETKNAASISTARSACISCANAMTFAADQVRTEDVFRRTPVGTQQPRTR